MHYCNIFRLLAEKVNKNERKNKAEILLEPLNEESTDFWKALGEEDGVKPEEPAIVSLILRHLSLHIDAFSPNL